MRKRFLTIGVAATALLLVLVVVQQAGAVPTRSTATLTTPGTTRTLELPANADQSPVISLGTAIDPQTGGEVQGYAIIHYKNPKAKPSGKGGGGTKCYGFLSSGAKWKTVEPWVVNPINASQLDADFIFTNLAGDIGKWETAALKNILGEGASTLEALIADISSPDGKNEVYFANVSDPGAIAVTIVWGYFYGPPSTRELVEWDQVYDDVDYPWSSAGEAGKMDFENIATHELGHSVGMADMYDSTCSAVTMYGYARYGETTKRTLEAPDITGVRTLYK